MRISLRKFDRAPNAEATQETESRNGFVLVEVIVAMVLLAIAVSSLAVLMLSISKTSMGNTGGAYRNAVLMNEVNRLEGIPYDSIHVGTTSIVVSTAPYPHTRVITVAEPIAKVIKTVQVVITPTNPKYKPDTVNFNRTNARTSRVLCTDCAQ